MIDLRLFILLIQAIQFVSLLRDFRTCIEQVICMLMLLN